MAPDGKQPDSKYIGVQRSQGRKSTLREFIQIGSIGTIIKTGTQLRVLKQVRLHSEVERHHLTDLRSPCKSVCKLKLPPYKRGGGCCCDHCGNRCDHRSLTRSLRAFVRISASTDPAQQPPRRVGMVRSVRHHSGNQLRQPAAFAGVVAISSLAREASGNALQVLMSAREVVNNATTCIYLRALICAPAHR